MRRPFARLAAACVLAVATAVFCGAALAGGGHGNSYGNGNDGHGNGNGGWQQQPQPQPQQSHQQWHGKMQAQGRPQQPADSTAGQQQAGVKPSSTTQHWTHTTAGASPDVSKRYGNGKTAAEIATSRGAPASQPLTGPGNSQPHKTYDCGHKSNPSGGVDVHAIKSYSANGCASTQQQPQQTQQCGCAPKEQQDHYQQKQQPPVEQQQPQTTQGEIGYCHQVNGRWVYATATAGQLAEIVKTENVIAPHFAYEGRDYAENWTSSGQSIFEKCHHGESVAVAPVQVQAPVVVPEEHKVTICHATGSQTNPYVEITVDEHALKNGHTVDKGDIIPAPAGGCPTAVPQVPLVTFCAGSALMTLPAATVVSSYLTGANIVPPFTLNGQGYSYNWPAGEATFNDNCVAPAAALAPVAAAAPAAVTTTVPVTTTVTTTTTTTVPAATTTPAAGGVAGTSTTVTTTAAPASTAPEHGVLGAETSLAPKPAHHGVLGAVTRIAGSTLPFTGFPVWLAMLIALGLILAGITLRRRSLGTRL